MSYIIPWWLGIVFITLGIPIACLIAAVARRIWWLQPIVVEAHDKRDLQ